VGSSAPRLRAGTQRSKAWLLVRIETEVLDLLGPVRVGIPQALDIDATRQVAFDGCLDELGSKEREREREIDLAHRAAFALCQLPGVSDRACHDLVEPSAAARDGVDQTKASLSAIRPDIFSDGPMRHQDLPKSF
jgi:hypothetical protein